MKKSDLHILSLLVPILFLGYGFYNIITADKSAPVSKTQDTQSVSPVENPEHEYTFIGGDIEILSSVQTGAAKTEQYKVIQTPSIPGSSKGYVIVKFSFSENST